MKQKIFFNITIFLFFLIGIYLGNYANSDLPKLIPGLLMLYYLPGNNINSLILTKYQDKMSWNTKLALDITSSISIVYLSYSVFKSDLSYLEPKSYVFIIALNLSLFILNILLCGKNKTRKSYNNKITLNQVNKTLLAVALIPIALFIVRLVFNPYIYELDSSQYFHIYNNILEHGYDTSWLTGQRNGFALYMIYTKYISGINFIGFIKFFTPLIFYITSLVLFDLTKKIINNKISALSYLLILGSPFLTIANEGVRPETFVFIFTYPVFYLIYVSLKYSRLNYLFVSLLYSYTAYRFHEAGFFLLLASLFGLLIFLFKSRKYVFAYIKQYLVKVLLISLPYLVIFGQNLPTLKTLFSVDIIHYSVIKFNEFLISPHWDWWFLNNYTAIDGGNIKWPGYTFLYYYLYNGMGIIVLFIIVVITLFFLKHNLKLQLRSTKFILPIIPIIVFLSAHLIIAEVFPRMGLFILPNRAWPHIMLSMVFLIIVFIIKIEGHYYPVIHSRKFTILLLMVIASGVIGSMVGSIFMGGQVLPAEKGLIKNINELPSSSIVTTTQVNENLVEIYGKKTYLTIKQVKVDNKDILLKEVNDSLENFLLGYRKNILVSYSATESTVISNVTNNSFQTKTINEKIIDNEQTLELLKEYFGHEYDKVITELNRYDNIYKRPIYFVYSFAKFNGVLAKRDWWFEDNDPQNLDWLKNYTGDNIVYKDASGILLKIR